MSISPNSNKTAAGPPVVIQGVCDGVLILPARRYRRLLRVSSVGFELSRPDQQDGLIARAQTFLNSLTNPLPIIKRQQTLDRDRYLANLSAVMATESQTVYRRQIDGYVDFVHSLVAASRIKARQFYIVVPLDADAGLDFELVQQQLRLRCERIASGLSRLGTRAEALTSPQLLELFFSLAAPNGAAGPLTDPSLAQLKRALI
jgi:hypothetical protein